MDLEEIRKEIDQLDRQIAQLLTRRMECSNEVIEKVRALTKAEYADALENIYNCIMQQSKENQQRLLEKDD